MDHRIRQRLNEIRQKQLESHNKTRETSPATAPNNNPHYIFLLAGLAAGLIISIIVWMVSPLSKTDDVEIIIPESHVSIDTSSLDKANEHIEQLNNRLELLSRSIDVLETRLNRLRGLSDSNHHAGMMPAHTYQNRIKEAASTESTIDANEAVSSRSAISSNTVNSFNPTHSVTANLNLRPSASLDSKPVATLSTGTKVEYMHESGGGWYYVNTEQHGKGWCASKYLSPLQPSLTSPQPSGQEG